MRLTREELKRLTAPVIVALAPAGTLHGWCVRDMPLQAGKPIYDEASAERAWAELTGLFAQALE